MKESHEQNMDMECIYQKYENLVYRFLYARTHDSEWSRELMQKTFLRAITSITRYDGTCKLSVWLCQIAKHVLWQEFYDYQTGKWHQDYSVVTERRPGAMHQSVQQGVIRPAARSCSVPAFPLNHPGSALFPPALRTPI